MSSEAGLPSFFQFQGKTAIDGLMEFELGGDLEDENISLEEEPVDHEIEITEADINGVPLSQDLNIDIDQYLHSKGVELENISNPPPRTSVVSSENRSETAQPSDNAEKANALLKFLKGSNPSRNEISQVTLEPDIPMQAMGQPYPGNINMYRGPLPFPPGPFPMPPPNGLPFPPPPFHSFPMPPPNLPIPPVLVNPVPPTGAWSRPPPFLPPRPLVQPPQSRIPPHPPMQTHDRVNQFEFLKRLPHGTMMRPEEVRLVDHRILVDMKSYASIFTATL